MRLFLSKKPNTSVVDQTFIHYIGFKYSTKAFIFYAQQNGITKIDNPYCFTMAWDATEYISSSYIQWCMEYMYWLFNDMYFPLDIPVVQLEIAIGNDWVTSFFPKQLSFLYTLYPLDYICVRRKHFPIVPLLDFFLQRKAPSHQSYGWCMNWFKSLYGGEDVWCIKRLFDAGADLKHTTDGNTIAWYHARLKCRKKCILFMGCAKRKKGMTFPRDVARLVGKWMWDKRFCLFP